ncbi:MAG: autotransporter domain-containing protein [Pseudomonadota bacterium]
MFAASNRPPPGSLAWRHVQATLTALATAMPLLLAAWTARAQSDLLLFVPTNTAGSNTHLFTTNPDGTLTTTATVGSGGSGSALASAVRGDQAFAYVAFFGSNRLQVIDSASRSVVQTVTTAAGPLGVAVSPDGTTLYISDKSAGTVSVYAIAAATGLLTQTASVNLPAGAGPRDLTVSPDGGKLYVVDQNQDRVVVVDTATNTVTATVSTGLQPINIAINPSGTRAYVTNTTSGNLTVIDTSTNSVVTTLAVGSGSWGVAVAPNGRYFYATDRGANTISIFDSATNTLVGTASAGSQPFDVVISPDGSTLYATNLVGNTVQAFSIDASTGLLTSLGTVAAATQPTMLSLCGNGGAMMGSGGTFVASTAGALGCAGSTATFTGGTLLVTTDNLTLGTPVSLGNGGATVDTNGNDATLAGAIAGTGGLTKTGLGTLTLTGSSTYSGATSVGMGTLQAGAVNAFSPASAHIVAGGATLALAGFNQSIGSLAGAGSVTLGAATLTTGNDNTSTTFSGVISGSGGLSKIGSGTLTLSGANSYSGGTVLAAGGLTVSGSLASGIIVNGGSLLVSGSVTGDIVQNAGSASLTGNVFGGYALNGGTASLDGRVTGTVTANGGTLSGSGAFGGLTANGATVAPGNSIGTMTVGGNFSHAGGLYQVEVNGSGQSDLIAVGGGATIGGTAVQVLAQPGAYARNTTYTILTAAGGVTGTYSGVTSNLAFLTPSLSYGADSVYLTLLLNQGAFAAGARTANQYAVGTALDRANAGAMGDFDTVLNALSSLSAAQGPSALDAISGQPYADFGTTNIQAGNLFMNALGQQMAVARAGTGSGQRVALAEACGMDRCEGRGPWSAWASGLGGFGGVSGNGNAGSLTYNSGGAAAGLDYRVDPRFLAGLGIGYLAGNQWVDGFTGRGWTSTVAVSAYGSFMQGAFYVDALAGYAYSNNQMQRQITIAGLQPRTASGSTGANQALGQIETGYRIALPAPMGAAVTPFGRLQAATVTQNAFSEWGASALSLNVAQQTTNSLRSTLGAEVTGAVGLGNGRALDLALRLGWLHEFADVGRPITAAFSGAPAYGFTVYGATPQRDSAAVGFSARTAIADSAQLYLRYDGEVGAGSDNHTVNLGVRFTW